MPDKYTKFLMHGNSDRENLALVNKIKITSEQQIIGNTSIRFTSADSTYITCPDSDDWDFGTGDFTLECWVNFSSINTAQQFVSAGCEADGASNMWNFGYTYNTSYNYIGLNFVYYNGSGYTYNFTGSHIADINTWYHVAVARDGATMYFFFDGSLIDTWEIGSNTNLSGGSTGLILGARYQANQSVIMEYFDGHMDGLRISKGIARYTSSFTPETQRFEKDEYTKLLFYADDIADVSDSKHIISKTPTAISYGSGKFNTCPTFNGSSTYLTTEDSDDWDFGTGDFTIECWVKFASSISGYPKFVAAGSHADGANHLWCFGYSNYPNASHYGFNFGIYNGSGYYDHFTGAHICTTDVWYHVALVREGANIYFFCDGTKIDTWNFGASVAVDGGSTGLIIGARYYRNPTEIVEHLNGNIDELKISKGIARYNQDFTPPTRPEDDFKIEGTMSKSG